MSNNPFSGGSELERVMTTNKWPVPYYKRMFKAYPVREEKSLDLKTLKNGINETHALLA